MAYKLGFVLFLYSKFSHTTQDYKDTKRKWNLNIKSTSVLVFNTDKIEITCLPEIQDIIEI